MISSDVIRGYTDIIILFLLWEEDSYGYELSRKIGEIAEKVYSIKETTLYSAFARLEKNGYIASYSGGEETKGRRRTYYKISESGKSYYRDKCKEWDVTKVLIDKFIREEYKHANN